MADVDLTTTYLGLELANPIVASSSPLTRQVETMHELVEAGVGAIVLASVFEEEIDDDAHLHGYLEELEGGIMAEAVEGHLPMVEAAHSGLTRHLAHIHRAADEIHVPVIGSLNGSSPGGWTQYAAMIADAGVDALELNVYLMPADVDTPGEEIERRYLDIVEEVRAAVTLPLAVKVGPYFSSPGHMCRRLVDAGADGLVLFNRFLQPEIDLETLAVDASLHLSSSEEARLATRWMAILFDHVDASLAATSGVWTPEDAVRLLLAGADVAMTTSALLKHGPAHVGTLVDGVRTWFQDHDYDSVAQARGSVSRQSASDPEAFERSNYARALRGFGAD